MLAVTSARTSRGWSLYDVREGKLMDTPQRLDPTSAATYFLPMTWSADGSSIAGVQMEAGRSAGEQGQKFPVFLYSVRDRTYRPVSASGGVLWMSDSRRLLVYDNTEIAIVDTETGRRKSLLTGLDRQAFNQFWRVSLSRDDRHIAVVTDDAEGNLWMLQGREVGVLGVIRDFVGIDVRASTVFATATASNSMIATAVRRPSPA
jgi:WD40 repeat protein